MLDILPSKTPEAVEAVRARLYAARFPVIFAGHLPVAHLQPTPRQMPFLPSLLDDAFAALPPLRLPGGDAWVGVAARALTAEQLTTRLEPQRSRNAAGGRRRRRAAGLRAAGAVLLCLAALGVVLGLVLRGVSAPEPGPMPAEPTAIAAPVSGEAATREIATPVPQPVPELVPIPPPAQAQGGTETTASPASQGPVPAPPPSAVEVPSAPSPHAAPTQPRRSDAAGGTPPSARRPPERSTPRRQQESAGAASPSTGRGTAATPPEAAPQRCGRIEALVGSGAPLGEGDMRFFNETCIRW